MPAEWHKCLAGLMYVDNTVDGMPAWQNDNYQCELYNLFKDWKAGKDGVWNRQDRIAEHCSSSLSLQTLGLSRIKQKNKKNKLWSITGIKLMISS